MKDRFDWSVQLCYQWNNTQNMRLFRVFDLFGKTAELYREQRSEFAFLAPSFQDIFFKLIYQILFFPSQMSEQEHAQAHDAKNDPKTANRWNNISSDQDDESEQSEKEEQVVQEAKQQQKVEVEEPKEENKKKQKEAHIVPFDAKKKFRGEFANLKTVKGGFKAEKLEKKTFHLDTIKNPFATNDDSSDSEEEKQEEPAPVPAEPQAEQPEEDTKKGKKDAKKSKKQQQKEELQAFLKEMSAANEKAEDGAEKKKKKKKAKKAEGEQAKQQTKAEEPKAEVAPVAAEQFKVDREAIEELMKKKAEAAKPTGKKNTKTAVVNAAKKAIEQREAKNKAKKVYVDL